MPPELPTLPWDGFNFIDELRQLRTCRPRTVGCTMVIDTGLGLHETADVLDMAGDYIDLWKLSCGTSVFMPSPVLKKKLRLIRERGVDTMPGGTLFEAAIVQQDCRVFMTRALELGFTAVEISDGTIPLSSVRRRCAIDCARDVGLITITEVGKKDEADQPSPAQIAEEALQDLEWGAHAVIIEGRESGKGIGVYDRDGNPGVGAIETIAHLLGDRVDRLIWEAPLKPQQAVLIAQFGSNVGLGNIDPRCVLSLEALRVGLRFESLKPIADKLHQAASCTLEMIEEQFSVKSPRAGD